MKQLIKIVGIFVVLLAFVSCNEFEGDDPQLHGTWSSGTQLYHFFPDKSYSIENSIKGDSINPVVADSIFGVYNVDTKRSNITFDIQGYKVDSNDVIVYKALNSTTWNYTIDGEILKYESNTTIGELTKK